MSLVSSTLPAGFGLLARSQPAVAYALQRSATRSHVRPPIGSMIDGNVPKSPVSWVTCTKDNSRVPFSVVASTPLFD